MFYSWVGSGSKRGAVCPHVAGFARAFPRGYFSKVKSGGGLAFGQFAQHFAAEFGGNPGRGGQMLRKCKCRDVRRVGETHADARRSRLGFNEKTWVSPTLHLLKFPAYEPTKYCGNGKKHNYRSLIKNTK